MVLQDLFDTLAAGEFSNLALANSTTGSIKLEAYPKVVKAINRSLRELYKRFVLKKKKVILYQQAGLSRYYLRKSYRGTLGATSADAYLVDFLEAFDDDLVRILGIKNADDLDVALNPAVVHPEQTYFTSAAHDTLDLITAKTDQSFIVQYQASYPKIVITEDFDPETYNLYYPPFIEEALAAYIASLLKKGKETKASEGEGYQTNTWAYKYEQACQKIVDLGLAEEVIITNTKLDQRGFI